jgi:DNA-binding transcriptional ArsR family regulator
LETLLASMEASAIHPDPASSFDWEALVALLVHPVKVSIIEAMDWIGEPLSATDLDRLLKGQVGVSLISYHLRKLVELGVIKPVRKDTVRGAVQTFYALCCYSSN